MICEALGFDLVVLGLIALICLISLWLVHGVRVGLFVFCFVLGSFGLLGFIVLLVVVLGCH